MSNPATLKGPDPDFGRHMAELAKERGVKGFGGRKPIADRFKGTIAAVESKIAGNLEDVFDDYIAQLKVKDPEQCSTHKITLTCNRCGKESERMTYNHAAAQYLADRIMGRPTSRSENTITLKLYEQLSVAFVEAFREVNALADPDERLAIYAEKLEVIDAQYGRKD